MNPLRSLAAVLGLLLLTASAVAVEPHLEFVRGLRDRDYHDTALAYLEKLERRGDLPPELREVLPFEKALTLLEGARSLRSPDAQGRQLDQAREQLEKFLAASPNHPAAAQANTELAQYYVSKGRVEVLQSRAPANIGQKGGFQKKARAQFAEARKVFAAANERFQTEYDKFDKFIPKTEKARLDAREDAYVKWIQAQLNLARLTYEEAQTYDKGSDENRRLLGEASTSFEQIHARYRTLLAGLHARMWQGKCFEEQDDITKAMGIYDELLTHGGEKPTPALKSLQDRVLLYRLICLNHEKRKDYQVVRDEATGWTKANRSLLSTPVGLGILWELIRAEEFLARKEETSEAERGRLLQDALTTARLVNRYPGEYRDVSTAAIQRLMLALDREPKDPRDFATAFGTARNLIDDIRNRNKAIVEARGGERQKLTSDLQPVLREAARMLQLALALAGPKDDDKDVNRARYFLSYVYYSLRDYSYDAAVLGEFVGRKFQEKFPDIAQDAAYLAQAAYIQAYNREPEGRRAHLVPRILSICRFITEQWPESDKANDARMDLGRLYGQMQQPAEAARWYMQVPESAPQFLEAQLAAGDAFRNTYYAESIRPEAERKPAAELEAFLQQARTILQNAVSRYESQLPKELDQVDPSRLAKLTEAKLTYAQILNGSGDYQGALQLLREGPLSVVAAVAAPDGDDRRRPPRPNIRSVPFASFAHQQVLRSYIGTRQLDEARAEMKRLETIEGAGGGGAALTQIFVQLGRELEKEVQRLQAAGDARLGEVLQSFETFLDNVSERTEGQDYSSLMWVAETYRALGEGLDAGDGGKASGYFAKAVAALQQIIDETARQPGFAPEGAISGVKLRKVTCLRRQNAFDEARKLVVELLTERPKALDAQFEAARVYQDWAGDDRTKWALAIDGDRAAKKKGNAPRVVWGWSGIAEKLATNLQNSLQGNTEYEEQFLDASYNVAWCRFQDAQSQSSRKAREPLLEMAKRDVIVTAMLSPEFGGTETYDRFNRLYRDIQKEMVDAGLQKTEIADLELKAVQAKKIAAESRKTAAGQNKKKPAAAASKAPTAATPKTSGSELWTWLLIGVGVVGGGGAAIYFALIRKPPRAAFVRSDVEFTLEPPPPRKPAPRTKA